MPSKESNRIAQRKWYAANKELHKKRMQAWREANPNHISEYVRRRRELDPVYRLKNNLRARFNIALRKGYKCGSAIRDLGCSVDELRSYLEGQFKPGMSWENYGEWQVDHRVPLAAFDLQDPEQVKKALHFTNLQPLWRKENLSKGSKRI